MIDIALMYALVIGIGLVGLTIVLSRIPSR